MADRVASDHPSVRTVRATVTRRGGTRRLGLELPESVADDVPAEVVRLVIDDTEYHAPTSRSSGGGFIISGAYPNARKAREGDGPDVLAEWLRDNDRSAGRTVAFDIVVPSFRYGVRLPSEDAVYDTTEPPSKGLRDIADSLDGD